MASRAQVAAYVAERLKTDRKGAIQAAASWLIDTGRGRQVEYLARDVAQVLADDGYVYARVTTARPLTDQARAQVEAFIRRATGAHQLELETGVDRGVIGGGIRARRNGENQAREICTGSFIDE
jgi:F0F1-type ATP synthase delta subunit